MSEPTGEKSYHRTPQLLGDSIVDINVSSGSPFRSSSGDELWCCSCDSMTRTSVELSIDYLVWDISVSGR